MKFTRNAGIILLVIFNIALDQISKFIVRAKVDPYSETPIIGDYFTLHNVENKGAFLGMGSELNDTLRLILLLILPLAVLGYVMYYIIKNKNLDKASVIGFSCIVGGGIANVYDRVMYGSVTDFFHIDLGGVFRTGIFNVADMSVMLGLGLLLYSSFKNKKASN
ncbi:signal peptidase II [Mangrovimonas sp. AS39]|uniref:signal peptidase II n=1 Tax=Mangrovimonas futianensis TaxID=2895523 RepID=UPI001E2A83A5|nr:signal peptidase II [Mangrovimonas futianensis]MCF1192979.1 signal peptidase II [Mangrovimonas futianensis]MCF1196670.1 signal peptidase II [Mangrovimonas futianensis]MCF1421556.1 signal peptidase II [Mangrovimonas futianensis]